MIVSLLLEGRRVAIVGTGPERHRRIVAAASEGAEVFAFGPAHCIECESHLAGGHRGLPSGTDLAEARLVIAVDRDRDTNSLLAAHARRLGFLLNTIDEPETCDFYHVSVREADPGLLIAVSSSGRAPAFARSLADRLLSTISAEDRTVYDRMRSERAALKDQGLPTAGVNWVAREAALRSLLGSSPTHPAADARTSGRDFHLVDYLPAKGDPHL